jgi:hypothetical protein
MLTELPKKSKAYWYIWPISWTKSPDFRPLSKFFQHWLNPCRRPKSGHTHILDHCTLRRNNRSSEQPNVDGNLQSTLFLLLSLHLHFHFFFHSHFHYITLHYITLHYITLHYITLHYIILFYFILFYFILFYFILFYFILFYFYRRTSISGTTFIGKKCLSGTNFHAI